MGLALLHPHIRRWINFTNKLVDHDPTMPTTRGSVPQSAVLGDEPQALPVDDVKSPSWAYEIDEHDLSAGGS